MLHQKISKNIVRVCNLLVYGSQFFNLSASYCVKITRRKSFYNVCVNYDNKSNFQKTFLMIFDGPKMSPLTKWLKIFLMKYIQLYIYIYNYRALWEQSLKNPLRIQILNICWKITIYDGPRNGPFNSFFVFYFLFKNPANILYCKPSQTY